MERRQKQRWAVGDSLLYAGAFALVFWWPFLPAPWPELGKSVLRAIPYGQVTYEYLWLYSFLLGAFTVVFVPRDLKLRLGWLQAALALVAYGSIIWKLGTLQLNWS